MSPFLSSAFRRKKWVILALLLVSSAIFAAVLFRLPLSENARFDRFTSQIFQTELSGNTLNLHYTVADPSAYDISADEITLGDDSLAARQASCTIAEDYLTKLGTFDYEELSSNRQLTFDILMDSLETEVARSRYLLYDEPLSPTLGVQAQLPILLAEYTFRTKGDIEDYLSLLAQIPDYFDSLLSFEREKAAAGLFMSPENAQEVASQCEEFIQDPDHNFLLEIFYETIDSFTNLTADEKAAYKHRFSSILNEYVIPAYQEMAQELCSYSEYSQNEMGLCYLPEGTAYYEYLVKSLTGDDRSVSEIEEAIKVQMVNDFSEIQNILQSSSSASDTSDTRETAAAADAQDSAICSPESMLADLRQKITEDFPLLPSVSCEVKYVHESLQDYLSPAFYLTPAIDDYENNVIYINPASNYTNLELFTTLAHEGYPGHLYQSVYFNASGPDQIRLLLDTGGYTEGWATYVEMYAYSLWDGSDENASLMQHNRAFSLGLASFLDIGIHYHGYTLEDVTSFLQNLGFSGESASELYQTILQSPGNYLRYYVGYLNFCSLRDELKAQMGSRFTLKEYHRRVLETGPAPFSILRRQVLETDAST